MQASKIKPEYVYAIKTPDTQFSDRLLRFHVTAVITRRERSSGSPHDYTSSVEGYVVAADADNNTRGKTMVLAPDKILGEFVQYAELAERARKDKEVAEAQERAAQAKAKRLLVALYEATGCAPPDDDRDYKAPFRANYGSDITVTVAGVEPLLKLLDSLKTELPA